MTCSISSVTRDLRRLADSTFDLLIIGGGIYGTTAAWDATQRGLSVALIDRGDFGGGTSGNSAKTVHGGIRALRSLNITELRQFVRERRALSRIVPHLVQPLPFVIPTYRGVTRNRWLMRLYFALNDLLAHDRNDLPDPSRRLPASRLLSREACLALNPAIDPTAVTGGIEWFDCQMYNSDRLNLSFLLSAVHAGATAANYVEATDLLQRGSRVQGVRVRDHIGDERFDVAARVVLNCAGPWAPGLLHTLAPDLAPALPTRFSKAMNLVTARPLVGTHAVGGSTGSRLLFISPWRGCSIVGTSHEPFVREVDDAAPRRAEVERFLAQINVVFPKTRLALSDVRLVHRGLLPAANGGPYDQGDVALLKTSTVADHRTDGMEGLISVLGVRYTTARDTATHAIDTVFQVLGKPAPRSRTAETALVGGDIPDVDAFVGEAERADVPGVEAPSLRRIALSYGTGYVDVLRSLGDRPGESHALGEACAVTRGEVRRAVREEMAVRLSDVVLRRTEAGSAGHPGRDALRAAADLMAAELDWPHTRVEEEIAKVETTYEISE